MTNIDAQEVLWALDFVLKNPGRKVPGKLLKTLSDLRANTDEALTNSKIDGVNHIVNLLGFPDHDSH